MIEAQHLLPIRYATGCETDSKKLSEVCDGRGQPRLLAAVPVKPPYGAYYKNSVRSGTTGKHQSYAQKATLRPDCQSIGLDIKQTIV